MNVWRGTLADWLAHGPALCAAGPPDRVELADKAPEPYPLDMNTDETDGVYWQVDGRHLYPESLRPLLQEEAWRLPPAAFGLLRGGRVEMDVASGERPANVRYAGREAAEDALSAALLEWACRAAVEAYPLGTAELERLAAGRRPPRSWCGEGGGPPGPDGTKEQAP